MANPNLILNKGHLVALRELLWPARAYYSNIYSALGFNPADLHEPMGYGNNLQTLYSNLMQELIRRGVSKQDLVKALRAQPVGHTILADELKKNESIKNDDYGKTNHYISYMESLFSFQHA